MSSQYDICKFIFFRRENCLQGKVISFLFSSTPCAGHDGSEFPSHILSQFHFNHLRVTDYGTLGLRSIEMGLNEIKTCLHIQLKSALLFVRKLQSQSTKMSDACSEILHVCARPSDITDMMFVQNFTPQKCVLCDIFFLRINRVNASNINDFGIFWL